MRKLGTHVLMGSRRKSAIGAISKGRSTGRWVRPLLGGLVAAAMATAVVAPATAEERYAGTPFIVLASAQSYVGDAVVGNVVNDSYWPSVWDFAVTPAEEPQTTFSVQKFGLSPVAAGELDRERGAGLEAQAPAVIDDGDLAVILWDEFRRPPGTGGNTSYSGGNGSTLGSSINGSSF